MEFLSTVDLGVAKVGRVEMRATIYQHQHWVDLRSFDADPVVAQGGQYADVYVAQQESDPAMAEAMQRMRRRIGAVAVSQPGSGLAALRMRAGLSQRQLAERLGNHQPAIARWERNPEQMSFKSIQDMAAALGVPEQAIFDAQRSYQQEPRESCSAEVAHS